MTHSSIISHLYSNFASYRELWSKQLDETEEFGAFVFLPGKNLEWEWWTILDIRDYIRQGGLEDDGILEGLVDLNFVEEFLVLVIEYVDGPKKQAAHFHRMNRTRLN